MEYNVYICGEESRLCYNNRASVNVITLLKNEEPKL